MSQIDQLLAEIEARAAKATPGTWELFGSSLTAWGDGRLLMEWIPNGVGGGVNEREENDGQFIAAARADIPRLVAALRVAVDDIKGQLPDCERYGWLSKQARLNELMGRIESALKGEQNG